jgi:hypothetical protein
VPTADDIPAIVDLLKETQALVDGILTPSLRTPPVGRYTSRQQVFFVPPNQLTIPATFVRKWRMELEFGDDVSQSVSANTRVIDWEHPWFQLSHTRASVPAFAARPHSKAFAPGIWHPFRVKYT